MSDMAKHSDAGSPLRRAHFAAWFTFVFMAGTTMAFQTYHSVETGQMPWPLAVLYGIGAFVLAISVLEFARHAPPAVRVGAYALTAGAMYLSASATGDVTRHAAPPHAELLFGLLMDGAALLAIHFILNGPRAADAVSAAAKKEAALRAEANTERSAREEEAQAAAAAEAGLRAQLVKERAAAETAAAQAQAELRAAALRAESGAQAAVQAALGAAREAQEAREQGLSDELTAERRRRETAEQDAALKARAEAGRITAEAARSAVITELQTARTSLETAETARREAELRASQAEAKAASLARRLGAAAGAKGTRNAGAAAGADGGRGAPATKVPSDFDAQAAALAILAEEPDISGSKLAERVGKSERWGQTFKKNLAGHVTGSGGEGGTAAEGD